MCIVYNTVGSLTYLKNYLRKNNIDEFNSLKEVVDFQKSFDYNCTQIILEHKKLVSHELTSLEQELRLLENNIEELKTNLTHEHAFQVEQLKLQLNAISNSNTSNLLFRLTNRIKAFKLKKRINSLENNFFNTIDDKLNFPIQTKAEVSARIQFIRNNFDAAVKLSAHNTLAEIQRKNKLIKEASSFIYGALGEQKVVNETKQLSDEYCLINDFTFNFSKAIYSKQNNEYIKSIQIDHIIIGPSGIFLLETKNWNLDSLNDASLRSPIKQIQRSSYAFFILINNGLKNRLLKLDNHHWGEKKIPIRNLIVLTDLKPNVDFQYVKVLTISEIVEYVKGFKPVFSKIETNGIVDYLLNLKSVY